MLDWGGGYAVQVVCAPIFSNVFIVRCLSSMKQLGAAIDECDFLAITTVKNSLGTGTL